jgi:hypothetical protein
MPAAKIMGAMADRFPDEPPWVRELERFQAKLRRYLEPLRRQVDETHEQLVRTIQASLPDLRELARDTLARATPDNWREFGASRLEELAELTAGGLAVVWVPRHSIVAELLDAQPHERDAVLIDHRDAILVDLDAALREIPGDELADLVSVASEAVAAAYGGYPRAAQALTGAILTNLINVALDFARFNVARERFRQEHWTDVGLIAVRHTALLHCLASSLEHTDYAAPGFNRHSTAGHAAMVDQYTDANCLRGLLLLVGLLREFSIEPTDHS